MVATPPVENPTSVTVNDPGVSNLCDGVAEVSSDVSSPKIQRYWLMVVVATGTNRTVKGAVPVQDGALESICAQPSTVKSMVSGSGPTSAGGVVSGGALSVPASATGDE